MAAQTVTNPRAVTSCKTIAGDDGLLFHGYYGMVHAPVEFDEVRAEEGKLITIAEVRDGLGVLVIGGTGIFERPKKVKAGSVAPREALVMG